MSAVLPAEEATAAKPCWCGSADLEFSWREPHYGLIRCRVCGCRRIDPPPVADDASSVSFYRNYYQQSRPSVAATPDRERYLSRFWNVAAQEAMLLETGGLAVDIGCGDGDLCGELARAGWKRVAGLDVSTPRVDRARARHPHLEFFDRPISETPIQPGTADLLVMDNVIEHLPDPLGIVRELGGYLASDGRIVIITPNMESGHARLLGKRWTPELAPHAHIFLFTPASLRRLVENAGLEVEALGTFHQPGAPLRATLGRAARGDVKSAVWRAGQDIGGLYGRLIGSGPMLYAVARPSRGQAVSPVDTGAAPQQSRVDAVDIAAIQADAPAARVRGVSVVVCTYRRPESAAALFDSLERQDAPFHELVVIDASGDEEAMPTRTRLLQGLRTAGRTRYVQVGGTARGLTRQRNAALRLVTADLVLFLDDDVRLQPECVREMEAVHRNNEGIAGVGCYSDNQFDPPALIWRVRRAVGIIPSLQPGRYWRSGMSNPWGFSRPGGRLVEGDWLPGCAMMWRTDLAVALRFDESLQGYAQAEDLDFSLRAKPFGRLVMLGTPRLRHLHEAGGRPDPYRLGYMELRNRYEIHRRSVPNRRWRDVAWFGYAWLVDTLLLARHLAVPGRFTRTIRQMSGRTVAVATLLVEHVRTSLPHGQVHRS
jgi:SAM-dependent methyltransferase/GT2 family glycosyltransferase